MKAHEKGWIAGAVWGVAEVLRTYGEEVLARHMLSAIGGLEKVRKHAEPCDIEEIEKYPWVHESNVKVVAPPSEGAASMQKGGSEMTSKIRLAAGWRLPTHGLLCFFIFSGQAVFATSSPLDQIPSPSGWSLGILALVGVLGALLGAWVNPTQPNKLGSKKATQPQQAGEQKTDPRKQGCKTATAS